MNEPDRAAGFGEAMLGDDLLFAGARNTAPRPLRALWALLASSRWGVAALTGMLAAFVFVPYVGAVGLWDPWETHYGEVARQMVQRGDLVYPYWEAGWFFSKPPLTMWLAVPGLWLTGAGEGEGALSRYTEWALRLPFALLAVSAVALLSQAVARACTRRAGLATGFALSTMPLFFFVARQAMTDMPFVGCTTLALACAIIALFDPHTRHRTGWWRGAFVFAGLGTLAKGLLGIALPVAIVGVYLLGTAVAKDGIKRPVQWALRRGGERPWIFNALSRVPWGSGLALFGAVALPWYVAMVRFGGRDPEGRTFFERFFLHDHFARFSSGVHTTTPGGTFVYFIEQAGYGVFPWVALVPAALVVAAGARWGTEEGEQRLGAFALGWVALSFALFTSSATKFHHYVLPVLPGLAVLLGLTVDRVWRDGLRLWAPALALGAVLYGLVARDLVRRPRHLLDLFTYNYERPFPEFLWAGAAFPGLERSPTVAQAFAVALGVAAIGTCLAAIAGSRVWTFGGFWGLALGLAVWLSWSHWVDLSHHWTQRDLFWRYFALRQPDEPIAVFFMDWKGETFYSRNRVLQIKPGNEARAVQAYVGRPGRQWLLVEHLRSGILQRLLGPNQRVTVVDPRLNNKFVLIAVDEAPR